MSSPPPEPRPGGAVEPPRAGGRTAAGWRPRNLRAAVASFAGSGLLLLAVAGLAAVGAGPL